MGRKRPRSADHSDGAEDAADRHTSRLRRAPERVVQQQEAGSSSRASRKRQRIESYAQNSYDPRQFQRSRDHREDEEDAVIHQESATKMTRDPASSSLADPPSDGPRQPG
ncbi:hypothetical protein H2200_011809 [Cladophialophora chaetospira]|uniref:Uncharacterized protein n=1 Tax=Cladophialophora chaetospira TaxID=386627 RepID=A0AA39CCV1_9EURO|nr:hypothetical protein H2200_011809 [Cladophialophora chaetospira]